MKTLQLLSIAALMGTMPISVQARPQQTKEDQKKTQKEVDKKAKREEQKAKKAAKSFRSERTYY